MAKCLPGMPCYNTIVYTTYPKGCATTEPSPFSLPLASDDLYYAGPNLPYTGIQTEDELTVALQRIDVKIGELTLPLTVHTQAETLGEVVFTMSSPANNDDPTVRIYQNRVTTTDATVTTLHTLAIPLNTTAWLEVYVVARRTGGAAGAAGDSAGYFQRVLFKNIAGTVTQVSTSWDVVKEDQGAWHMDTVISGTDVLVQVTGAVNNNIVWHLAELKVMMVST